MKGFRNTTRMSIGHDMSRAGQTVGRVPSFARGGVVRRFAEGGKVHRDDGEINGLDESWEHERHEKPGGNALVERDGPKVSEELEAGGGRSPLRSGYAHGGKPKEKHFHVHNHYHNGKRLPSKSKLKKMEMMAAGGMATGGTRDRLAKGGKSKIHIKAKNKGALHRDMGVPEGKKIPKEKIRSKLAHDKAEHNTKGIKRDVFALNFGHKGHAEGGHIFDDTHTIPPDYATGGTINELSAGGAPYGGMATGGTINELGVGGMPNRPVQAAGPPVGALAAMQAQHRAPMPARRPGAMPMPQGMPMPAQGGGARPLMRAAGGVARAKGGRSSLGSGVGRRAGMLSGNGIAKGSKGC